jgi:hypothetical protein
MTAIPGSAKMIFCWPCSRLKSRGQKQGQCALSTMITLRVVRRRFSNIGAAGDVSGDLQKGLPNIQ